MKRNMGMKGPPILITLLIFSLATFGAASKSETDDDQYTDDENYDYETGEDSYSYDGEDSNENSTDYNYSYSYDYEEESELNYIPELITRPQRIVVRQGETAELPCEANVRHM